MVCGQSLGQSYKARKQFVSCWIYPKLQAMMFIVFQHYIQRQVTPLIIFYAEIKLLSRQRPTFLLSLPSGQQIGSSGPLRSSKVPLEGQMAPIEAQVGLRRAQAGAEEGPWRAQRGAPELIEKRVPPSENVPRQKSVRNVGFGKNNVITLPF